MNLENWEYGNGTYTNKQTGEILEYLESRQEIDKSEFLYADGRFARLYMETVRDLPPLIKREQKLLWFLLTEMNYDNIYIMDISGREKAIIETGMPYNTLNSALSGLYKNNVVIKLARGRVQVNLKFFSKGSAKRVMALKYSLYRLDGKYFEITEMAIKPKKENDNGNYAV